MFANNTKGRMVEENCMRYGVVILVMKELTLLPVAQHA